MDHPHASESAQESGRHDRRREARRRSVMYALLTFHPMFNYMMRPMLAPLAEFVAAEAGYTLSQKATLLAAFFPIFIPSQLVAAALIQRFGAKVVSSVQNFGITAALLLAPWAMQVGGHVGLAVSFTFVGIFQSPLFPAISVMKKAWTAGVEPAKRALLLRMFGAGSHCSGMLATLLTPALASRHGWQRVPYVFGGMMALLSVVWHLCASEEPQKPLPAPAGRPAAPAVASRGAPKSTATTSSKPGDKKLRPAGRRGGDGRIAWQIFKARSVQACLLSHVATNNMNYMLLLWGPTFYIEQLGVARARIGGWLAIPNTVPIWGSFLVGAIEAACLRSGVSQLNVRTRFTRVGTTLSAVACMLFAFAPSAPAAVVMQCTVALANCYSGAGTMDACILFLAAVAALANLCSHPCTHMISDFDHQASRRTTLKSEGATPPSSPRSETC